MRPLYAIFGITLLASAILLSYLFYKDNREKLEIVNALSKTSIVLKDKKSLINFLNEWQVFGGEAYYFDSVSNRAFRGVNIRKVQIIFTDIPQPTGLVQSPPNGENVLITSYFSTITGGTTLLIKVYLNEEYLLQQTVIDRNLWVTQLGVGTLFKIFHPVTYFTSEKMLQGSLPPDQ